MVAPIDARATLEAEDETITLVMNWRTIALAEEVRADAVTAFGGGRSTLSGMALLVWAFAQPEPGAAGAAALTRDEALALCMRHGEATGKALARVFKLGAAAEDDDDADAAGNGEASPDAAPARPPRRRQTA